MNLKISAYVATTLDGFIARPDGNIDWLMNADQDNHEDYGYRHFTSTVDCLVMGRLTFQKIISLQRWPHKNIRTIVLSSYLDKVPPIVKGPVEIYSGQIEDLVNMLVSEGVRRIYVDGGKTIQSFLNLGMLTDLTITYIPTLIGYGLPLFAALANDIILDHKETRCYKSGFVQSVYHLQADGLQSCGVQPRPMLDNNLHASGR